MDRRIFARLFNSAEFGQILIEAMSNDDGNPCLRLVVDTHPDALNPTSINLSFTDEVDAFEKLSSFTDEQAETFAKAIHKQAGEFVESN